jgi:hypothetical protein
MTGRARRLLMVTRGLVTWALLFYVAAVSWADFVAATGDTTSECDRGQCGTLGEFTANHDFLLFLLILFASGTVAGLLGWIVGRALRRYEASPNS